MNTTKTEDPGGALHAYEMPALWRGRYNDARAASAESRSAPSAFVTVA